MNEPIIKVRDLDLWYGEHQALRKISMDLPEGSITAPIRMRQIHVPAEYQPDERLDSGLPGGRNSGVSG